MVSDIISEPKSLEAPPMTEPSTRRQFIVSTVAAGCAAGAFATQARAVPKAGFRLNDRHEIRLKVQSKKLHNNGRLFVAIFGKADGEDHFKDDYITWGPFGTETGVTKSIYLPAGNYEIRIDGGFIEYSVQLQGRNEKQHRDKRIPFRTLAARSGAIRKKG